MQSTYWVFHIIPSILVASIEMYYLKENIPPNVIPLVIGLKILLSYTGFWRSWVFENAPKNAHPGPHILRIWYVCVVLCSGHCIYDMIWLWESGWTLPLKMRKHGKKRNKLEKERWAKQTKRSTLTNSLFFRWNRKVPKIGYIVSWLSTPAKIDKLLTITWTQSLIMSVICPFQK